MAGAAEAAVLKVNPFESGEAGFVVSSITYALGPDGKTSGGCPAGMTTTPLARLQATPEGRKRANESEQEYNRRLQATYSGPAGNRVNACQTPETVGPDPDFHTVVGSNLNVDGMDLDGHDSRSNGRAEPGTCGHDDFRGTDGQRGVDNQFYRLVGCTRGFQSTGGFIKFEIEMLTGSWGILIAVSGVDNPVNDDNVQVTFLANADPIQLAPDRKPLSFASYAPDADPRFQATARGRIVNGILTTEPVNVRFHHTINNMWLERTLDDARLRVSITKDGGLEGLLAGYAKLDNLYDHTIGFRSAKDAKGKPAAARMYSSLGAAGAAGMTCNGIYYAMQQLADGHRDPKTGKCTSMSMQYRIKAIRAFIVKPTASGQNLAASQH